MANNLPETLYGLVSHFSPSGQERGAVDWLVARMQSLGAEEAFRDEAGNAVGVWGSGPKQVILLGHIDTVPGEIELRVVNSELGESKLYGRGTVDAKGPLACFVDGAASVEAVDDWQIVVIGAVGEEKDSEGARFLVDKYRPDFLVVGEPNRWDRMALGYKGSAWANVTVRAEQFHTAHAGASACETAVEAWLAVKAFGESFNEGRQKIFEQLLLSLRGMDSGSDGLEQWARLSIGARLPVDLPPEEWYKKLNETLKVSETFRVFVEPTGYPIPAWACEKNSALVRAFLNGIRAEGGTPGFVYKTGTADLNVVAPVWRCPALVYGPGDSALDHTPNEHIDLGEYEKAVAVLAAALKHLMGLK
jgi:[amino group carrier protein]-lysine/ornithine hydrolase